MFSPPNLPDVRVCYVDEAGCTGALPTAHSDIQPVFVLAGVDFDGSAIAPLTDDFLMLKRRFFPNAAEPGALYLAWILQEIKGADLRRQAVSPSRRQSRHALGFLDAIVRLLEEYEARLYGRVWIKGVGDPFNGRSVYTFSLQYICQWFNERLAAGNERGIVVCDSRNKALNTASHSVFTQKFRAAGDRYPNLCEMPTFGHSENHAGVQIADLLCSAFLFPMAVDAYCGGTLTECTRVTMECSGTGTDRACRDCRCGDSTPPVAGRGEGSRWMTGSAGGHRVSCSAPRAEHCRLRRLLTSPDVQATPHNGGGGWAG